jgi:hypothetical protein
VTAPAGSVAWSTLTTTAPPNGFGGGCTAAGTPTATFGGDDPPHAVPATSRGAPQRCLRARRARYPTPRSR